MGLLARVRPDITPLDSARSINGPAKTGNIETGPA